MSVTMTREASSGARPGPDSPAPALPALWFSALTGEIGVTGDLRDRAIVAGQGCFVRDASGREYLDARSALWHAALGYSNHRVADAITRQLGILPVAQIIRHDQPTRLALDYAQRLVEVLPSSLTHVRFCTTGAQAVEGAVLLSRFVRRRAGEPDRTEVVALWNGYHGIAPLAAHLSGEPPLHELLAPLAPGVHHVSAGDLDAMRSTLDRIGRHRVTAVVLEPVLGTDVVELSAEYLREVQRTCQDAGIHLVVDEVSTGFGRTSSLTVSGRLGLAPDMLILSKGITAGYAPLSAIAVAEPIVRQATAPPGPLFPHGSTCDGHPIALAAADAVLDELADGRVLDNVVARGAQLTTAIGRLVDGVPGIAGVHGPGLMLAVRVVDQHGQPLPASTMDTVKTACRDAGLLVSISGSMVILTPPLVITSEEADLLVERLGTGVGSALTGQVRSAGTPTRPVVVG
jgi:adenosylmethionine-8-amino-7-oxononanoate aminotransferase